MVALTVFVIFSAIFITNTFKQREDPPVSIGFKEKTSIDLPEYYLLCPEQGHNASVVFYSAGCWTHEVGISGLNCSDFSNFEVVYSTSAELDCLKIPLKSAKVVKSPAYFTIEIMFTRKIKGWTDLWLQGGEDVSTGIYVGSGLHNSTLGVTNNIALDFELYSFISRPSSYKVIAASTTTSNYYQENTYAFIPVICNNESISQNIYCDDIKNLPPQCSDFLDPEATCVFLFSGFFEVPDMLLHTFQQIDPVEFWNIFGTLSAYWIVVGAIFGLFFGSRNSELLVPNSLARKLCFCILPKLDQETKKKVMKHELKQRESWMMNY
jgi:hypothetical protein